MKKSFKLSKSFISEIIRYAGGYLPPDELNNFFNTLEMAGSKVRFTTSSESNLLRVIQSFFDRTSIIRESVKYPHYLEILLAASANSNYICDILVRDPEFFYWAVNPSNLFLKPQEEDFKKTLGELTGKYKTFAAKLNSLKSFKRKEILRIALQDLLDIYPLKEITEQLSLLASAILHELFQICYIEISNKYKVKFTDSYAIVALGKLGGKELNYSSDTDLIIYFDKEKKYKSKNYSEYLTEAIKLFIESSSGISDTGYLYRIDLRLRPDGRNSALTRPLREYLNYYESKGEAWERQMLIKADFLSGSRDLYNKFISYLTPFIYPVAQQISPVEQVKKLKSVIEKNISSQLNIKLAKGGIRDIEFSVQVLQLLNGGVNKDLRQQNTLNAIDKLEEAELITLSEKESLVKAYLLFRKIEHYLQLMNDRQVHTIPEKGEMVEKMAHFLGYPSGDSFVSGVNKLRKEVRKFYQSVFPGNDDMAELSLFKNSQQATRNLEYLREGKDITGGKLFDQRTQKAFMLVEPKLVEILDETPDPDIVLQNLTTFIKSSGFPSIWYNEFKDESFLTLLTLICSYNQKGMNLLNADQGLQDFLLSRRVFRTYTDDELKEFGIRKLIFYLSSGLALRQLTPEIISNILSSYFITKINKISREIIGEKKYFIAALGSLGSGEMTFSSDLDLIFITDKGSGLSEIKFRKLLDAINKDFHLFKADCRLRPEGKASQLAWEIDAYLNYLETRGRTWELQALCKLEFISGDENLFNRFVTSVNGNIKIKECSGFKKDISEMRKKILQTDISSYSRKFSLKKSSGGLTDIDYLIQYLILCNPELYPACRGKSLPDNIDLILNYSKVYKDTEPLKESYSFLRLLEFIMQCTFDSDKVYYPTGKEKKEIVAAYLGISEETLDEKFKEKTQLNKLLFTKYLT